MSYKLLDLLKEELKLVEEAAFILDYSYSNCQKIGIKEEYSLHELDNFEAFTSRFARLSDILIQKLFRLIDKIELEEKGTVRDRINNAEKNGLIDNADTFVQIRIVRNDITHEYDLDSVKEIFRKVMDLTPHLLESVKMTKLFCRKYFSN
ncbi:MAG: hypothetical protein MRK02_04470 [Candidatus Scalindua sp.]|nr:hypothetical protein [Candidatus Scalindua sp.]